MRGYGPRVPETDGAGRYGLVLGLAAAAAAVLDVDVLDEMLAAGAAGLVLVGLAGGQYLASAVVGAVGSLGVLVVAWAVPFLSCRYGVVYRSAATPERGVWPAMVPSWPAMESTHWWRLEWRAVVMGLCARWRSRLLPGSH